MVQPKREAYHGRRRGHRAAEPGAGAALSWTIKTGPYEQNRKVEWCCEKMKRVNRTITRWLYKGAKELLGEEELESLKNDLIAPVKEAAVEALEDMMNEDEE